MEELVYHKLVAAEQGHWWSVARRDIILSVLRRHLPEHSSLLDIGCGTGYFLEAARRHYRVSGLDSSPIALEYCRQRGIEPAWAGGPDDLGAIEQQTFDAITLLDVIEHLDDDAGALRAIARHLSGRGLLLVTVPAYPWLWSDHDDIARHKRRYTLSSLRRAVTAAGFHIEKISYFNSLLFPPILAVRGLMKLAGRRMGISAMDFRPGRVNEFLRFCFRAERHWLAIGRFPAGVSLIVLARKRADGD
jgi:SAM-dependent methyltransferase